MTAVGPLTVLVVDDDARVRASLIRLFDEVGDVRAVAVDMDQAMRLSTLSAAPTDVALVDVAGPDAPGLQMVSRLALVMDVVAVSLHASMRGASIAAGASAFVEKDGNAESIVSALRSAAVAPGGQNVADDRSPTSPTTRRSEPDV